MTPEEVRAKYGSMFCKGFYTIVDEKNGIAQIVEMCISKGPIEWDVVNRKRTGGVITNIKSEGNIITMDTLIGEGQFHFGPVSSEIGGQGIYKLTVDGDEVHTFWSGIAGAGFGIGACIPQSDTVIKTIYPDDFKIGGAHVANTEIVTPKMVKVIIGMDDTDTKYAGASWVTSLKMATNCPHGKFLEHKIIQLNPKAPNKTTNCCSTAVSFAVSPKDLNKLIEYCTDFVTKNTLSDNTVITVFTGLKIPEKLVEWSWGAKHILYTKEEAYKVAKESDVRIINIEKDGGVVGAVAAIGCFDIGVKSAGLPEDFE